MTVFKEDRAMHAHSIAFLSALLLFSGCRVDPAGPAEGLIPLRFQAFTEGTRTSLGPDNGILWSLADRITVFSAADPSGKVFQASEVTDGGRRAVFNGWAEAMTEGYYYALYPAREGTSLLDAEGSFQVELPTSQVGVPASFADGANLAVARVPAEGGDLYFKNVGALLAVKVPGNYVTSIRISSRDPEVAMSGAATLRYNDGAPQVAPSSTSRNYVEITGLSGRIGKTVYAVVYPGEYRQGFEVSFITGTIYNTYRSTRPLSLGRNANVFLIDRDWSVSDDRTGEHAGYTRLIQPEITSCAQSGSGAVRMAFSCSSGRKAGYKLYRRDASSMGSGECVATVNDAAARQFTFTGLSNGMSYDFGVSAFPDPDNTDGLTESEITWFDDLTLQAVAGGVEVRVLSTKENYYNLVVEYALDGLTDAGVEHGLVFSTTDSDPTRGSVGAEGILPGPVLPSLSPGTIRQCIPNAALPQATTCYVKAYCYDNALGNYVYSSVSALKLASQPEGCSIDRTAMDSPSSAVSAYRFTADGKYSGWYAEADCSASSPVSLKVLNAPSGRITASTVASQAASSDAYVLVNGQIFGRYNQGIAYTGGSLCYSADAAGEAADYLYCMHATTYTRLQPITRAILGVDADGVPGAYWSSCLADGTVRFYDRPIPAGTAGTLIYPQVTARSGPGPERDWAPAEALSTGPMLLYDGKVCVSEEKIAAGVYDTNYELWETTEGNIYGSSRSRTAVGYDSRSGTIRLVVVSTSVTLTGMALILKGLGCDYAMNLDGGGSSGMYVDGIGMMGYDTRSVGSTIGFFPR